MSTAVVQPLVVVALAVLVLVIRVRTGHAPAWWYRWHRWQQHRALGAADAPRPLGRMTGPLAVIAVVAVLPWLAYLVIRPHAASDAQALSIASALPVGWIGVRWVRHRRVDRIGLSVVAVYGCAVASSALFGNSPTPLKLRDAGALGLVGVVCLGSVLVRRPLLLVALRHVARHGAAASRGLTARLDDPRLQRRLATATMVVAAVFLLATLVDVVLIATTPTATFLAVAGIVGGLTPLAAAVATVAVLRARTPGHRNNAG